MKKRTQNWSPDLGHGGKDYFARAEEWKRERAWHEGWVAGYKQGTRDMREAHGNTVDAKGQKTSRESEGTEGVPGPVEDTGSEEHITVASFPPFRTEDDPEWC